MRKCSGFLLLIEKKVVLKEIQPDHSFPETGMPYNDSFVETYGLNLWITLPWSEPRELSPECTDPV